MRYYLRSLCRGPSRIEARQRHILSHGVKNVNDRLPFSLRGRVAFAFASSRPRSGRLMIMQSTVNPGKVPLTLAVRQPYMWAELRGVCRGCLRGLISLIVTAPCLIMEKSCLVLVSR